MQVSFSIFHFMGEWQMVVVAPFSPLSVPYNVESHIYIYVLNSG